MKRLLFLSMTLLFSLNVFSIDLSASEILKAMDKNIPTGSMNYSATMELFQGSQKRLKSMLIFTNGKDKALVEFTNKEDYGVKFLKISQELWMYFPDEQDTVKISGQLLEKGFMGSDFSYKDTLETGTLEDKYTITLLGTELISERTCYIIKLDAKVQGLQYQTKKMWIDSELFISLKEEMYAKSGLLLKTANILEYKSIQGKVIATIIEMKDVARQNTKTVFSIKDYVFNANIPDTKFSLKEFQK